MLSAKKQRQLCEDLASLTRHRHWGGGGKALFAALGSAVSLRGRCFCAHDTLFPPYVRSLPHQAMMLLRPFELHLLAMGTYAQEGKLAPDLNHMDNLPELADMSLLKQWREKPPLKAPALHEP